MGFSLLDRINRIYMIKNKMRKSLLLFKQPIIILYEDCNT